MDAQHNGSSHLVLLSPSAVLEAPSFPEVLLPMPLTLLTPIATPEPS